jgi:tyrosyl-tRNA synthetase
MWRYLELLSVEPGATLQHWRDEVAQGRNPRDIKVLLAKEVVTRFHSAQAADAALAEFEARFRAGAMPSDMPEIVLDAPASGLPIAQLLKQAQLTPSTSDALRLIGQGGVRVNGERVSDKALLLAPGASFVVQVGKRRFARVALKSRELAG